jgi:hypothetical protein
MITVLGGWLGRVSDFVLIGYIGKVVIDSLAGFHDGLFSTLLAA